MNRRSVHRAGGLVLHVGFFVLCYHFAFLLNLGFGFLLWDGYSPSPEIGATLRRSLPIVLLIKTAVFWRMDWLTKARAVRQTAKRAVLAGFLLGLAHLLLSALISIAIPPMVIVLDCVLTIAGCSLPWLWCRLSATSLRHVPPPTLFHKRAGWLVVGAALVVCVAFPARMGFLLASVGENTLGYDYVVYVEKFDAILGGSYDWRNFPLDMMITGGSHCMIVPMLVRVPIILLTDWNQHVEIALGVVLALVKLLLLAGLLSRGMDRVSKAVLLALLSGLIFSLAQFESFQFGCAGMNQHMADVWFLGGCWFLLNRPRGWLAGMTACGVLASVSYGSGIFCWPTYLVGLLWLEGPRWKSGFAWLVGTGLSAAPYVLYRLQNTTDQRALEKNWLPIKTWIESLTLPFFPYADVVEKRWTWMLAGSVAVALGLLTVGFAFLRFWNAERRKLLPATLVLLYSGATLWLITFGRRTLAHWYGVHYALIWAAVLGYAFLLGQKDSASKPTAGALPRPMGFGWFAYAATFVVGLLLIPANRSLGETQLFLPSRSPVALSALREYRTAPTHYSRFPYPFWQANYPFHTQHAALLEKNGWSVFGRNRLYLLQGDFGLNCVTLQEPPNTPMMWVSGRDSRGRSYTDYRRLNLLLHATNATTWEVRIPAEAATATFQTAVGKPASGSSLAACEVRLAIEGNPARVVWSSREDSPETWQPCEISLNDYAGKTVRIALGSIGEKDAAAVWQAPRIQMQLASLPPVAGGISPSSADPRRFPAFTKDDVLLDLSPGCWSSPQPLSVAMPIATGATRLDYLGELAISCHDYSHFFFECSLSEPHHLGHNLGVMFHFEKDSREFLKETIVPLVVTAEPHAYCIDLRKQEIEPAARITKITLRPGALSIAGAPRMFQLNQARFVKRQPAAREPSPVRDRANEASERAPGDLRQTSPSFGGDIIRPRTEEFQSWHTPTQENQIKPCPALPSPSEGRERLCCLSISIPCPGF